MESTRTRMGRLGRWATTKAEITSLDESIAFYDAVTVEDVNRVAQRLLAQAPSVALVSPLDEGEAMRVLQKKLHDESVWGQ